MSVGRNQGEGLEAKEELKEVIGFLKEPERYGRLPRSLPREILLLGPPGTGKTLLARAVAGEAGVPCSQLAAPSLWKCLWRSGRLKCGIFLSKRESVPQPSSAAPQRESRQMPRGDQAHRPASRTA